MVVITACLTTLGDAGANGGFDRPRLEQGGPVLAAGFFENAAGDEVRARRAGRLIGGRLGLWRRARARLGRGGFLLFIVAEEGVASAEDEGDNDEQESERFRAAVFLGHENTMTADGLPRVWLAVFGLVSSIAG